MELIAICCVLGVIAIVVLYVWRVLHWLWFEPKKTEKSLREQGLDGSSYRFMFGDLKEMIQMTIEAKSKPMSLSHDIAPRVYPFFHKAVTTYGTCLVFLSIFILFKFQWESVTVFRMI